jgi:hypothetical protein
MPAVGSHSPQARSGGSWKGWSNFWGRHNGTWKKPLSVHVRSGGSWVKVWDERPTITNITTSYVTVPASPPEPETTSYYKNFTISANGFQTSITSNDPTGFGVTISQTTINADNTVNVTTETYDIGGYNASKFPTITASNASGSEVF